MPGFGPAAEVLFFREKDPKPCSPRSSTLHCADAGLQWAAQLARLKQGPPDDWSVSPIGRPEGDWPVGAASYCPLATADRWNDGKVRV